METGWQVSYEMIKTAGVTLTFFLQENFMEIVHTFAE